jgi:exopolyphosphatase/guanosine-5'-triphosphate,3'-diphosphate pyrophosphatase
MRIAALDLGSNTFHLIVVDVEQRAGSGSVEIRMVERARELVRLGVATLVSGVIPTDGFERGLDALTRLRAVVERHTLDAFLIVATAAIREAANGREFVAAARAVIGADIRIVDGHEEARLIYFGARGSLDLARRRVALFDLGGGSLELIVADGQGVVLAASLKLGVLRLRDQWLGEGPYDVVAPAALAEMQTAVRESLAPTIAAARSHGFDFVAFTAGTARALRAMAYAESAAEAPPATLTRAWLATTERRLASLTAEARAALPGLDQRRVDTLLPGAVVLHGILELTGSVEGVYCEAALREGMIAAYLAGEWDPDRRD